MDANRYLPAKTLAIGDTPGRLRLLFEAKVTTFAHAVKRMLCLVRRQRRETAVARMCLASKGLFNQEP